MDTAPDPRINIASRTEVAYKGKLCRIVSRELRSDRKPGIGRVTYTIQLASICLSGVVRWGTFHNKRGIPATQLSLDTKGAIGWVAK